VAVDTPTQLIRLVTPDGAVIAGSDALQGTWTEEQYLRLTDHTVWRICTEKSKSQVKTGWTGLSYRVSRILPTPYGYQ